MLISGPERIRKDRAVQRGTRLDAFFIVSGVGMYIGCPAIEVSGPSKTDAVGAVPHSIYSAGNFENVAGDRSAKTTGATIQHVPVSRHGHRAQSGCFKLSIPLSSGLIIIIILTPNAISSTKWPHRFNDNSFRRMTSHQPQPNAESDSKMFPQRQRATRLSCWVSVRNAVCRHVQYGVPVTCYDYI